MSATITHTTNNQGEDIKLYSATCGRCNHTWKPRKINYDYKYKTIKDPVVCANCRSPYWNKIKGTRESYKLKEVIK